MHAPRQRDQPRDYTYALAYRPRPATVEFRARSFYGLQTVKGRFL